MPRILLTLKICLKFTIYFFSGEVRHNWLNTIKEVPKEDALFSRIPLVEKGSLENVRKIIFWYTVGIRIPYRRRYSYSILCWSRAFDIRTI
jgi:hypothetical protein